MATRLLHSSSNISERKSETKKRVAKRLHEIIGEFNNIEASEKVHSSYLKLNEALSKRKLPDSKPLCNQKAIESAVMNQATLEELREKRKQLLKRSLIDDMVAKEQEEKQRNKETNISSQRMLSVKQKLTSELCQAAQLDQFKKAVIQTKQNSQQIWMQTFLQTPPQAMKHEGKHLKSMTAMDGDMEKFMKAKRDQNFQEYLEDEIATYHIRGAKRPSSQFTITSPSISQYSSQPIQLPINPTAVRIQNQWFLQEHDEVINKDKQGTIGVNTVFKGINQDAQQLSGLFENRGGQQTKLQRPLSKINYLTLQQLSKNQQSQKQQSQPQQSLPSNHDDTIHQQNVIALNSCYDLIQRFGRTSPSKSTHCLSGTNKHKTNNNELNNNNKQDALSKDCMSPSLRSPGLFSFKALKPKSKYHTALKSYADKLKGTFTPSPSPFRSHRTPSAHLKRSLARTMADNLRKNNNFDNNKMPLSRLLDRMETQTTQPILRIQARTLFNKSVSITLQS